MTFTRVAFGLQSLYGLNNEPRLAQFGQSKFPETGMENETGEVSRHRSRFRILNTLNTDLVVQRYTKAGLNMTTRNALVRMIWRTSLVPALLKKIWLGIKMKTSCCLGC